jgi:hypothetical protein
MYVEKSVHTDKKGIVHSQYFLRQSRREGKKLSKQHFSISPAGVKKLVKSSLPCCSFV